MTAPPRIAPDHLVLTAANDAQADGYRLQLDARRRSGQLPETTAVHVIPDLGGRRIGSGGSTLLVFKYLAELLVGTGSLRDVFAGKRIFLLHAGGDSKRLPAYAAQGKLFTPLPTPAAAGQIPTLFDLLLANLERLPRPTNGHLLIAAGDVLLTFNPSEADFSRPGVTGVAYADHTDRAAHHGVYVADAQGSVLDFLQKPNLDELRRRGALDRLGRALVDTGLMSFDPDAVERFCTAAGLVVQEGRVVLQPGLLADIVAATAGEIDLYEEIALALPRRANAKEYRQRVLDRPRNVDPRQQERLLSFFHAIHGVPFHVRSVSHCDFFHIGTSRELLAGLAERNRTSTTYGFRNRTRTLLPDELHDESPAFLFNSVLESDQFHAGPATLLEGVDARCPLDLAGRNTITGLPAGVTKPVVLPEGIGLLMLPIRNPKSEIRNPKSETSTTPVSEFGIRNSDFGDWAAILYGIDDDFGQPSSSGLSTFLHTPLEDFLRSHHLMAGLRWPQEPASVYHAKLWPIAAPDQALDLVRWMIPGQSDPEALAEWRKRERFSLADLIARVDHERLHAHRVNLLRLADICRPFERLMADPDLDAAQFVEEAHARGEVADMLFDLVRGCEGEIDPLLRARCQILASLLRRRADVLPPDDTAQHDIDELCRTLSRGNGSADDLGRAASDSVAEALASYVTVVDKLPKPAIEHDQVVWATSPARLDLGGGWTDTPPICLDRGGLVVNAAVKLNGQYPLQAIVKLNPEHVVNLTSIDLGQRITLERIEQLRTYFDPSEWSSLPKACLCLAGFAAGQQSGDLRPLLQRFGGGIDLTIFSALPKGSGLGASSILGATVLACLARLTGETLTPEQLIARTSLLEQRMTTSGGWQDQVGGVFPGVKLIRTEPGREQIPALFWLAFHEAQTKSRLLLYYTGLKRLAKNILQNIVHRYLARDPLVLDALTRLKAAALELRHAIDTRDLAGFGRGLQTYWDLKKRIDPGSTNEAIERLTARVAPWSSGHVLLGAGGGGFLLILARDETAAQRLRTDLTVWPSSPGARFFEFQIDDQGLNVSVL
jgi:fucokinase